jgi:antitoxin component HigA of HigAB toxin-antitoxin module
MPDQSFETEPHGFRICHRATGFLRVAKGDLINAERFLHTSKITISIQRHRPYPIDILRHLMDANGLRQVDLLDVFGTASVISEVLKGKRELSKAHIAKLSGRFNVSPALFF